MLQFRSKEQCEQFQLSAFDISCATCERTDQECPWDRLDEPAMIARPVGRRTTPAVNPGRWRIRELRGFLQRLLAG